MPGLFSSVEKVEMKWKQIKQPSVIANGSFFAEVLSVLLDCCGLIVIIFGKTFLK